jgi:hypothetical protein
MKASTLERFLSTDRVRQQTAVKTRAGFARPVLCEQAMKEEEGPFLATNLRGSFLPSRRSLDGMVRFAFTECPVGAEGPLLTELHRVLWDVSVQQGWSNRCTDLQQARLLMGSSGVTPRAFIVGPSVLAEATGKNLSEEDVDKLMRYQGFVAEVDGVRILASDLPDGKAILAAIPSQVGLYVRSGDYLGVLICRANLSLVLVGA